MALPTAWRLEAAVVPGVPEPRVHKYSVIRCTLPCCHSLDLLYPILSPVWFTMVNFRDPAVILMDECAYTVCDCAWKLRAC